AARGDQDRHFRKCRAKLLGQLHARHVGQVVVEQGDARREAASLREPRRPVMGHHHRQAGAGEEGGHLLALDALILDDQDVAAEIVWHGVSPGAWGEPSLTCARAGAVSPLFMSRVEGTAPGGRLERWKSPKIRELRGLPAVPNWMRFRAAGGWSTAGIGRDIIAL